MQLGFIRRVDPSTRDFVSVPVENDRRFSHSWVLGRTGVGKSTALLRWALDDICAGEGIAVFDPHGDLAEDIIARIPRRRRSDVILFNPAEHAIPFNVFGAVPEERKAYVASSLTDSVKAVWGYDEMATPALDQFLFNGARALMDYPGGTLFALKFLLTSPTFRKRVLAHVADPVIADFWTTDFETHMPEREQRERTLSTLNKVGALIADPMIRATIAAPKSKIDFRAIMDEGKIFIAALPQGRLGFDKAALIGSLLLSQLHLAALSRAGERRPFHLYVDECHSFAPGTLAAMLSGIRKFGVSLVLAHQYLDQLSPKLRSALIGTVGAIVVFRTGVLDARTIEPEFRLAHDDLSLAELPPFSAYVRTGYRTQHLAMPECGHPVIPNAADRIRRHARAHYAIDAARLENRLARFIAGT